MCSLEEGDEITLFSSDDGDNDCSHALGLVSERRPADQPVDQGQSVMLFVQQDQILLYYPDGATTDSEPATNGVISAVAKCNVDAICA